MRLHLPLDARWILKDAPHDQRLAILPGQSGQPPAAIVTFGPIIVRPDEPRRWLEEVVRRDLPTGLKVELGGLVDRKTHCEWPVRVVEATAFAADGTVVEARLCAMFTFMDHCAVAIARTADPAAMQRVRNDLVAIFDGGRPDWRGDPICLADAWDVEPSRVRVRPRAANADRKASLEAALAELDRALSIHPTSEDHLRRGVVLLDLERSSEAAVAFTAAIGLSPDLVRAHDYLGVALGSAGKHEEAIACWERVLVLDPSRIDARYNIAQAKFLLDDYEGSLAAFQQVVARAPADVMVQRKVIQCLYALGRFEQGEAARTAFRRALESSSDPRARLVHEYVFDQFESDGFWVHAYETVQPRNPAIYPVLAFRGMRHDADRNKPLGAAVLVETSEQANAAGTPYVLAVQIGSEYRVIGAAPELPPYPTLKLDVVRILGEALRGQATPA
jgi:tetratricopeptide (TPR) repeat protein